MTDIMEHKMDIQELIDVSEKSLSEEFRKIDDIALYLSLIHISEPTRH